MWLIRRFNGVLWASVQCGKLARLVAAPGAMAPAVASATCQHFGADRLGGYVSVILSGVSVCWRFCLGSWECGAVFC